jgi:uncharacterized protein YcbK (DUF882 family)
MDQDSPPYPGIPEADLRANAEWRVQVSTGTTSAGDGIGRRTALAGAAFLALTTGLSKPAGVPSNVPAGQGPVTGPRSLSIVIANTGETFSDVFADGDRYDDRKLALLSRLLRDTWSGAVKPVDPALFDILSRMQAQIGQPLRVLSGYRTWQTNRFLQIVGFDVAEHSQHVAAKAVDFTVPGFTAAKLGDIARRCGAGGVGVYRSGFVHVDTGAMRNWVGA